MEEFQPLRLRLEGVERYLMEGVDKALVVNFGGQYAHLIARRLREAGVYAVLVDPEELSAELVGGLGARLVVLSGGPKSVYEPGAPTLDPSVLESLSVPVLGICYGHQLIAHLLGGSVERGEGEYGRTVVEIVEQDPIFEGWGRREVVWMSHADFVSRPPPGFKVLAYSEKGYVAAMRHREKPIYGVQFHPEVSHTPKGKLLFRNLVSRVSMVRRAYRPEELAPIIVEELKRRLPPTDKVLVAVSGGVDSVTTAVLLRKAVGSRAIAVFVDHGLLRAGEREDVLQTLNELGLNYIFVDASERFLSALEGTRDCEARRRIVGELFAEVFKEVAEGLEGVKWLAQGTLYPDIIESGAVKRSSRIKSHHNVAGLPEWLGLGVVEPLAFFYKDEVRRLARAVGVPDRVVRRHPFPGPGLAVRVMGVFTREKLEIARKASAIVEEELERWGLYDKVWQAFAVVGDDRWVGVKGDEREEGYVVVIRVVESEDGMTADYSRLPYELLDRMARRITSEVPKVVMVAYAVTTKPPATIEPC